MYLHHLTLQAIGPFADRVDIDFAALGASGVFLLEGPTGSGKSTIIDAVVFALYGSLAGDSAGTSRDRLHSHRAAPTTEPFVELVFQTAAGVHRVRRTPAYERPKQRGSGTVTQQASARLWRLASPDDTVGEPVSDRAQEVGGEVTRIVGLDRAQFVQTVVLPQGEFARFLRAPGEDRRALLQSLFGTEIYVRTAEELAAGRRAAIASVEQAEHAVADALSRFEEASGRTDLAEDDAAEVLRLLTDESARAEDARAAAGVALEHRRAAVDGAARRAAALDRRTEFLARRDRLLDAAAEVEAARARLAAAERAGRVLALLRGLDTARAAARKADAARDAAIDRHGATIRRVLQPVAVAAGRVGDTAADARGAGSDMGAGTGTDAGTDTGDSGTIWSGTTQYDADGLADRAGVLREAVAGSRHLVGVEHDLPARRDRAARERDALTATAARLEDLAEALEERPVARAALTAAVGVLADRAEDLRPAERALADAEDVARRVVALEAAADRLGRAEVARRTASDAARVAIAHEADLRTRRAAGLAGELGATLVDGEPCPVCGAVEHPSVALPTDGHPDVDSVQAASDARAAADTVLAAAATEHALSTEEHRRLGAEVGDATPESALAAIEAARQRREGARAAVTERQDAEARVGAFDRTTTTLESERRTTASSLAGAEATLAAEQAAIAADEAAVADRARMLLALRSPAAAAHTTPAAVRASADTTPATVSAAADASPATVSASSDAPPAPADEQLLATTVALVDRDAGILADVAEVLTVSSAAAYDFEARAVEVAGALAEHDFVDADSARAAALTPQDAADLRDRVAVHERERAVVESTLAEPSVLAAAEDTPERIDLAGAQAADALAVTAMDAATASAATTADRLRKARARAEDLDRAIAVRESTSAASRAVVRLADIAAAVPGTNPTGITLGTYVLMRRFEDVVAAANSRLGMMLGGRFALQTSDERESSSRARRTGLALAVLDHETGRTRDPKSLSGGETFTTSLCLALGLADVVQAEAGGVELGTLFVDEGFGTLDPETLDGVVGQLAQLSAGGRQIGIVSHVEELKLRIPDRVEVRRAAGGGSRVSTTV